VIELIFIVLKFDLTKIYSLFNCSTIRME